MDNPVKANSTDPNVPAVEGDHSQSGTALDGKSARGMGVHGTNDSPLGGSIKPNFGCGVWGESTNGYGVFGSSDNSVGVIGHSVNNIGITGHSVNNIGLIGQSDKNDGVHAQCNGRPTDLGGSTGGYGLFGVLTAVPDTVFVFRNGGSGVAGVSTSNVGVLGVSSVEAGVEGRSPKIGVSGWSIESGIGVFGAGVTGVSASGSQFGVSGSYFNPADSSSGNGFIGGRDPVFNELAGVYGESDKAGVFGNSNGVGGTGLHGRGGSNGGFGVRGEIGGNGIAAIHGQVFGAGSGLAGQFVGDVSIEGKLTTTVDIILKGGKDLAERFVSVAEFEHGSVMIIGESGALCSCVVDYDKRVVGVISGAGTLRPAITLGDSESGKPSVVIAMVGTVFCWVDADRAPIEAGDLLTSSDTEGHAMKAVDLSRSVGAIIGKALAPIRQGRGLIPMLVTLQ